MSIYDLNNTSYLRHDVEDALNRIDKLYTVEFKKTATEFLPRALVDNNVHWTASECQEAFNKLVPEIKSLTKDMYAILEQMHKGDMGEFDKPSLELKYAGLKELRLLNNKFKHFFDSAADISLTSMVIMRPEGHLIDAWVNYNYPANFVTKRFSDLISTFLTILEDINIITINRVD
jgi:hypothetical protein